jgi:hypothetical protein
MSLLTLQLTLVLASSQRYMAKLHAAGEPGGLSIDASALAPGWHRDDGVPQSRGWVSARDTAAAFVAAALTSDHLWSGYACALVSADDSLGGDAVDLPRLIQTATGSRVEVRLGSALEGRKGSNLYANRACKQLFGWVPRDSWDEVVALIAGGGYLFDDWKIHRPEKQRL